MKTNRSWMLTAMIFFLLCSLVAIPNGTVYAASFTVNDTRDRVDSNPGNGVCRTSAGTCTLRAAIQEANARSGPDVIQLRATTYMLTRAPLNENNISTGDLDITAPLTILGSSSGVTIIDGGTPPPGSPLERTALDRLFEIHPTAGNVTFERLTIREGWDEKEGGAIYNRSLGAVRLVNVNVLNSFAGTSGGGIYYDGFEGGSMLLDRSTITGNSTNGSGGGIYITNGRLTVIGTEAAKSTISGNSARDGGGLYHTGLSSQVDLSFTNVSGNLALNSGGGIYNGLEGELSLADVSISTNAAVGDGGGLASVSKASLSVTRGTFSANTADSGGGGVFTQTEESVTIDASTFSGNAAGADGGGGLYVSGKGAVNVTGSVVSGNTAIGEGGGMALHSDGPVDISDTTVNDNISQAGGGGILASGLVVSLARMNITHNTALEDGGGIDNQGSGEFAILDTSILSNTALNGGGLSNRADSMLLVSGSTFWDNHAAIAGGGFLHQSDAATDIVNTTLSGNRAGLNGGGLYLDADAGLHVINTTITLNSAPHGSGVGTADAIDNFPIVSHPLLLFRNTIVAGNIGGPDCHAAFGSEGGNLDGGTLCNFQGPRDRVNVLNLGLEVLADNGGPTQTHALTADSLAVGGGVNTALDANGNPVPGCPATDQRGVLREQNRACDIGAYEFEGTPESQPPDVTHPETSLDSGPADSTENTGASFAFSASEPGSTFECSLDAAPFTPCVSPVEYAALREGVHTFEVRAIDPAGNTDPTPASFSWTIELPPDGTPPETTIDSSPAAITESRDATFTFSASELNSTFECSLDGVSFAPCTSPAEYAGLTAGSHTFAVRATDLASNQDPTPASFTWTVVPPPDSTPPETAFTSGPASPTESTDAIFIFIANEPGSTFECALDGPSFNACISLVIYAGLSVGEHTFAVRATDPAGNLELTSADYTWTIVPPADITPPETALASGPASPTESTTALFTFSASESGATFECALDGTLFAACVSPVEYANLSAGDHTFEVRAIDLAGNVDPTPEIYTWTIEGVEPPPPPEPLDTFIDSGPAATTESRDATFTFSASEPGATFECALDGVAFAACVSPVDYTGLALGGHTFEVRAIDLAGNVDQTPAAYAWKIELPSSCGAPVILFADADAWIDENSSSTNKGDDSILKVQSKSPSDNFRALVRFAFPVNLPEGCVIKSATLSLYAASATQERTLEALQIAEDWSENEVTWVNQPQTTGPAATTDSAYGNLEWDVTSQLQAMYAAGTNNGFLIRDSVEGNSGAEQQLHSREKGENPPQLVITFGPAP